MLGSIHRPSQPLRGNAEVHGMHMYTGTSAFQWTFDRGSSDQMMHGVASSATWIRSLVGLADISIRANDLIVSGDPAHSGTEAPVRKRVHAAGRQVSR
jgi:hypothetical protein